jgi:hypothetical protein
MPKRRGEQAVDRTLNKVMKEVAVMQELQVGLMFGGWGVMNEVAVDEG